MQTRHIKRAHSGSRTAVAAVVHLAQLYTHRSTAEPSCGGGFVALFLSMTLKIYAGSKHMNAYDYKYEQALLSSPHRLRALIIRTIYVYLRVCVWHFPPDLIAGVKQDLRVQCPNPPCARQVLSQLTIWQSQPPIQHLSAPPPCLPQIPLR